MMTENFYAVVNFQSKREFQGRDYIYKVPGYLFEEGYPTNEGNKYGLVSNLNLSEVDLDDVTNDTKEKFASSTKVVKVLKIMTEEEFIQSDYVDSFDDLKFRNSSEGELFEYKNLVAFFDDQLDTHIQYIRKDTEKEKLEKLMNIRMQKLNEEKSLEDKVNKYADQELNDLFNKYKSL